MNAETGFELVCNQCQKQLEEDEKGAVTTCKHVFCFQCAQALVQRGSNCPTCDEILTKNTIRVVQVMQPASKTNQQMVGQRPDLAIDAAKEALHFFMEQVLFTRGLIEEDWMRRVETVQARCKEKLDNIYTAYKATKASEQAAQRDLAELQEKYQLKSRQLRDSRNESEQLKAQLGKLQQMLGMGGNINLNQIAAPNHIMRGLPAPGQQNLNLNLNGNMNISPPMGFLGGGPAPNRGGRMPLQDSRLQNASPNMGLSPKLFPPSGQNLNPNMNQGGGGGGGFHDNAGALAFGGNANNHRASNQLRRVMDPSLGGMGMQGNGGGFDMSMGGGGGGKMAANRTRGNNTFFNGAAF